MKKPVPSEEVKKPLDFIQMKNWIDEKYGINSRDYGGKYAKCPNWAQVASTNGVSLERAEGLYKTPPIEITDPVEKAAYEAASAAVKNHCENTPYLDFWHFQIDLFRNFSNDSYQTLNLKYQLEACEEDWQKEIAQLWLDEFGEYMNEEGEVFLWVSW